MGLGQYDGLGEYCGPHTASSMFLILIWLPKDGPLTEYLHRGWSYYILLSGPLNSEKTHAHFESVINLGGDNTLVITPSVSGLFFGVLFFVFSFAQRVYQGYPW